MSNTLDKHADILSGTYTCNHLITWLIVDAPQDLTLTINGETPKECSVKENEEFTFSCNSEQATPTSVYQFGNYIGFMYIPLVYIDCREQSQRHKNTNEN